MQKIPTVFVRDPETNLKHVRDEVHPDCQWVLDGEGIPTRKWDGTCVRVSEDGSLWARREVKKGKQPPPNFEEIEHDPNTGKTVGWEPADQSGFSKFIHEAYDGQEPGTYELCGPKINGNPEGLDSNVLVPHGTVVLDNAPRDFEGLSDYLLRHSFEGIVWHHEDGRRAKLKRKDFPSR